MASVNHPQTALINALNGDEVFLSPFD